MLLKVHKVHDLPESLPLPERLPGAVVILRYCMASEPTEIGKCYWPQFQPLLHSTFLKFTQCKEKRHHSQVLENQGVVLSNFHMAWE